MTAESVEAVMREFKKAILERALGAEMMHHLGYAPQVKTNRPDRLFTFGTTVCKSLISALGQLH